VGSISHLAPPSGAKTERATIPGNSIFFSNGLYFTLK
jgi:hypothetical protein